MNLKRLWITNSERRKPFNNFPCCPVYFRQRKCRVNHLFQPDPGQFFPGPRLDVKERIPLALRLARKEGARIGLDTLSPETAEIALVVQVHRK